MTDGQFPGPEDSPKDFMKDSLEYSPGDGPELLVRVGALDNFDSA